MIYMVAISREECTFSVNNLYGVQNARTHGYFILTFVTLWYLYLVLCGHADVISDLLLSMVDLSARAITSFSVRHRSHLLVPHLYLWACRSIRQKDLRNDVKEINSSDGVLVHGDKSNNIYVVPKKSYNKMVDDSVTKTYRKAAANTKNEIDLEGSEIAERLELANRMEVFAEKEPFITLKDHKANFDTKPMCRLINPTKSEMGVISKNILDKINNQIRRDTGYNQLKNTADVIEWFKRLPDKRKRTFIQFDIESFYPSIKLETLIKALTWAETIVNISPMEREIIMHARRSLLFHGGATWIKKDGSDFDVTMGSYDGAEVCELVGLYMLHLLSQR